MIPTSRPQGGGGRWCTPSGFARIRRPGRFGWEEKVEYWALIWGTGIMVLTGFFLWNPIATTAILRASSCRRPGWPTPPRRCSPCWRWSYGTPTTSTSGTSTRACTGATSVARRWRSSPSGTRVPRARRLRPAHPEEIRHRARRYVPSAAFVSVILLVGVYLFIVFESTAISTVEPIEGIEAMRRSRPLRRRRGRRDPRPRPRPPRAPTWDGTFAAVFGKCSAATVATGRPRPRSHSYRGYSPGATAGRASFRATRRRNRGAEDGRGPRRPALSRRTRGGALVDRGRGSGDR